MKEDDWRENGGCVIDYGGYRKLVRCDSEEFTHAKEEREHQAVCANYLARLATGKLPAAAWVDTFKSLRRECEDKAAHNPSLWLVVLAKLDSGQVIADQKWCLKGAKHCKTIRNTFFLSKEIMAAIRKTGWCSVDKTSECFTGRFSTERVALSALAAEGGRVIANAVGPLEFRYQNRRLTIECESWLPVALEPNATKAEFLEARSCQITRGERFNIEHLVLASPAALEIEFTDQDAADAIRQHIPDAFGCGTNLECTLHAPGE
jgi:hypothetical protein